MGERTQLEADVSDQVDRKAPCVVSLRWVPLSNPERPEPSWREVLLWNPCDGITVAYWSGGDEFSTSPVGGELVPLGGFTHWAAAEGPQPAGDNSANWRLWQGEVR